MRSLRVQLLVSHLLLVLLLAVVMSGAISSFFSLSRSIDRVLRSNLEGVRTGEQMRDSVADEQRALTFYLTLQPELSRELLQSSRSEFALAVDRNLRTADDVDEKILVAVIVDEHRTYDSAVEQLFFTDRKYGRPEAQRRYVSEVEPLLVRLHESIAALIFNNQQAIVQANQQTKSEAQSAFLRSVFITVGALLLAILLALRMVRMALTPLALLAKQAEVIGRGDLTRHIDLKRSDEIGALADSFNAMAQKLADLRKSEVRRLQRAERMSDAALESLYDPVIVTDARARIVYLNSSAVGLFGPVPVSPRVDVEAHVPDRRIVRAIKRAVTQEAISAEEDEAALVPIQVGGNERVYRLRANPMRTEDDLLLGAVAVLEDITYLKEVERLKTEFIGVASHELRTPVTSLLLSVQLLQEGAAGELTTAQAELVAAQRQDLERLEKLMRELLDITRLEAGTLVPKLNLVTIGELIASAVAATKSIATSSGVTVVAGEAPQLSVRADRGQIQRVFINLISNAVRHTPEGGQVTLRAEARADDVVFSVSDTGEGIPQDYLNKIFDRFVQVPGATQGGAGLGLSIAQTIVQAHGGSMSVESRLGHGSTFSFTLKREPEAALV